MGKKGEGEAEGVYEGLLSEARGEGEAEGVYESLLSQRHQATS